MIIRFIFLFFCRLPGPSRSAPFQTSQPQSPLGLHPPKTPHYVAILGKETGKVLLAGGKSPIFKPLIGAIDTALPLRYFSTHPKRAFIFSIPDAIRSTISSCQGRKAA